MIGGQEQKHFPPLGTKYINAQIMFIFLTAMHLRCSLYAVVLIFVVFVFSSKGIKRHDSARKDRRK